MITILDYGLGNVHSILNMLLRIGAEAELCSDPVSLRNCRNLILPGVGAFDEGVRRLREGGFWDVLQDKATAEKIPVLGICLGLQLMTRSSEEGQLPGLSWLPTATVRFPQNALPTPHVGWNTVEAFPTALTEGLEKDARFYFVHSYHLEAGQLKPESVVFECRYGLKFVAGVALDNLMGVQFHPEKSHRYGKTLLSNFAALCKVRSA